MTRLPEILGSFNGDSNRNKSDVIASLKLQAEENGYTIAEVDASRPWGGFLRLDNGDGDTFVGDFFEGLDPVEARLGNEDAELSPKFLVVSPGQRLSWQYHHRRAERWKFLNEGAYVKSLDDEQGETQSAQTGEVVQFGQSERHRLVGALGHYTLVAEIWQHTDTEAPSDESDIIRLADDYKR